MSPEVITLVILSAAVLLLLSDRLRPDLVALLVMLSLGLSGVLTVQEAFSGFSRSAVITILSIFILAEGLQRAGLAERMGGWLLRLAGDSEPWLVVTVTLGGALLSLFMNNIAAASLLLPAVMGAARKTGVSSSRLLIPMAFGTILGGMATLFTTTNIVSSGLLRDRGLAGYGVLDFAPLGAPLVLAGVAYLALVGRRLLPQNVSLQTRERRSQSPAELARVYQLKERLIRARIPAGSPLAGKLISQSCLRENYRLNVIAIERLGGEVLPVSSQTPLQPQDVLLLSGRPEDFANQALQPVFTILPDAGGPELVKAESDVLVEAVLAPRSALIGKTLHEVHFREKFQMSVIAIWRSGRPIRTHLWDAALQFGDALLLLGPRQRVPTLLLGPELIVLNSELEPAPVRREKVWLALLVMVVTLAAAALNQAAVGEIMLAGALAMVLLGLLSMDDAYRAIDWKTIFIIAGMLPLGVAVSKVGLAAAAGQAAVSLVGGAGPQALLAALVLLTLLLSQVINGAAVAALIVPLAIDSALRLGADPRSMTMGVALAASLTFLTPLGHAVNLLVMGPGGYKMRDYLRIGLPLTTLLALLLVLLLPLAWPL